MLIVCAGFAADIVRAQEAWKGKQDGAILTDRAAAYIAGIAMEAATDTQSNQLVSFVKVRGSFFSNRSHICSNYQY
jgi:hypothetical protein